MSRLSDDLEGLLRAERQHDLAPSMQAQGRAWARIQQRIVVGPPPIPIERISFAPAAGSGKLILLLAVVTWIGATVLGGVAAAVVVDAESGAEEVASRTLPEKEMRTETSESMVASSEGPFIVQDDDPILLVDDDALENEGEIEIVDDLLGRGRAVARAPARPGSDLAAETKLLRGAQKQLRAGSIAEATALLSAHRRQFPRGLLVDLRAALEIDAQCRQGQYERARALSESFERKYPSSPYRARVHACDAEAGQR